ncbi:hypothetical protein GCM10014719_50940 [Planomonospora parontospora subsp. antibiotica]|nr:hypothetical protein GCM10014719_50940 [Planomonospora parontospora subsp. antibiotica]GII18486.1 hypothetical protein Ppa05_52120 [Planomonospora parontospora subsp. antibiotica]
MFVTCLADMLFPEAAKATVRLLERLGHEVVFPAGQTCCGQMHVNTGYQAEALKLVRRHVRVFDPYDVIVTPSGSCAGSVRHQHAAVARRAGDERLAEEAGQVGRRTYELSELLVDVLGVTDVGAYYPHRVTYHPTWQDLEVFLQLLPRASTGERMNPYTSMWTGITPGDGPQAFHLVLLDNGRSAVLSDEVGRQALHCIRCSACLNVCPVYERTGGHAYGSVYPGPIGAVLSPQLTGVEDNASLPYASSLCGACFDACPVKRSSPADEHLVELLVDRLTDYRAHVHRAGDGDADGSGAAAVVSAILAGVPGLPCVVVPPGLPPEWLPDSVNVLRDDGLDTGRLSAVDGVVTAAAVVVAETGTIVLDGSADQGRRVITLLPDLHICIVRPEQVVAIVPEALARLAPDRPLTWISGPSATSDIELDRVEGVHGPRELHVVIAG